MHVYAIDALVQEEGNTCKAKQRKVRQSKCSNILCRDGDGISRIKDSLHYLLYMPDLLINLINPFKVYYK